MGCLKIVLIVWILFLWADSAAARSRWIRLKNWIDSADVKGCDTAYVHLPHQGFVAYSNAFLTGTVAYINSDISDADKGEINLTGPLTTRLATLFSLGICYRGWGLSYSRDFSSYGDTELSFSTYGQTYGAEFRLHNSHSLSGVLSETAPNATPQDLTLDVQKCHQRTLLANIYYVFNHTKFSLPAAMSHTVIQRRSSGSWLTILNFRNAKTHIDDDALTVLLSQNDKAVEEGATGTAKFRRFSQMQVSYGGGYAYNYVFNNARCLLHGSLMPMLSFWHSNRSYYDCTVHNVDGSITTFTRKYHFSQSLSVNASAHLSFVYNYKSLLTGVQGLFNLDSLNGETRLSLYTIDWSTRYFIGVRF